MDDGIPELYKLREFWSGIMADGIMQLPIGVKITYQGNVLYSSSQRTAQENFELAQRALCILLDVGIATLFGKRDGQPACVFETDGGKVEAYRSY